MASSSKDEFLTKEELEKFDYKELVKMIKRKEKKI